MRHAPDLEPFLGFSRGGRVGQPHTQSMKVVQVIMCVSTCHNHGRHSGHTHKALQTFFTTTKLEQIPGNASQPLALLLVFRPLPPSKGPASSICVLRGCEQPQPQRDAGESGVRRLPL